MAVLDGRCDSFDVAGLTAMGGGCRAVGGGGGGRRRAAGGEVLGFGGRKPSDTASTMRSYSSSVDDTVETGRLEAESDGVRPWPFPFPFPLPRPGDDGFRDGSMANGGPVGRTGKGEINLSRLSSGESTAVAGRHAMLCVPSLGRLRRWVDCSSPARRGC